ncbi:MAG: hypothetical protein AB7F86_05330 [Bdellovibrionales bacterium]
MRIEDLQSSLAHLPDLEGWWRADDLNGTEGQLREMLASRTESQKSESIAILSYLARVRALRGDPSEARAYLNQAEVLIATAKIEPAAELRYLLELGRVLTLSRSPQKASSAFHQAWNLAVQTGQDFFAIDAAVMLFTILPLKSQDAWLQQALQLALESKNPKAKLWLERLNYLTGWQDYDQRRYEEALSRFETAIAQMPLDSAKEDSLPLFWSKGRALRALGRVPEALALQMSILDRMNHLGLVNGHVYLEVAECKQLIQDLTQARTFFEMAHTALSTNAWFVDNRSDELKRMQYLFKKR